MAVLIGRGLDHEAWLGSVLPSFFLLLYSVFRVQKKGKEPEGGCEEAEEEAEYAPLAQLVEHLTLNQGVPGSSP